MTTFRPAKKRDFTPDKVNFHKILGDLGLRAKLIQENLEFEKRNKPTFKIKNPRWWDLQPREWVICFFHQGEWRSIRTPGSFWDPIAALPIEVREAHVFTRDGMHYKYYRRVYSYFKAEKWDICDFTFEDRQGLFRELKRGMRQRVEA